MQIIGIGYKNEFRSITSFGVTDGYLWSSYATVRFEHKWRKDILTHQEEVTVRLQGPFLTNNLSSSDPASVFWFDITRVSRQNQI